MSLKSVSWTVVFLLMGEPSYPLSPTPSIGRGEPCPVRTALAESDQNYLKNRQLENDIPTGNMVLYRLGSNPKHL